MPRMLVIFVGHGSPMNALENNATTASFKKLAAELPRPKAILSVSAHWETNGTAILHNPAPPTIHDFYGFPKALFDVQYPAPGSPSLAAKTQTLIPNSVLTDKWGFDHGTWSILVHMYPQADIPVYQLSLDVTKTAAQHFEVGQQLRALRDEGVLILGSGNIVHNLRAVNWQDPRGAFPWAAEFDEKIKSALQTRDTQTLTSYMDLGDIAKLSVPTPEHFWPLLYIAGAALDTDTVSFPIEGYAMGSLSMRSVLYR